MKCKHCGNIIKDYGYLSARYGVAPKLCENCRRELKNYRKKEDIKRSCIKIIPGVVINAKTLMPNYQETTAPKNRYCVFSLGGRFYGSSYTSWTGAAYNEKEFYYLDKTLEEAFKNSKDIVVDIRVMEKKMNNRAHIYYVLEKSDKEAEKKLIRLNSYYKTTLKGYGRDRNYKETVEGEYEELVIYSTSARSGRFGYCAEFIIVPNNEEIEIIKGGIE